MSIKTRVVKHMRGDGSVYYTAQRRFPYGWMQITEHTFSTEAQAIAACQNQTKAGEQVVWEQSDG